MNDRLRAELDRLYGPGAGAVGRRVAVLEAVLPAGWAPLSAVWKGVQADLDLPAPAIAVSGVDALQLWFSFASPASPAARGRLLRGLCERYLPGLPPAQLRVRVDASGFQPAPPVELGPQRWSAFVTPDLASVFGDTPWLDIPPNGDGQAMILQALRPMPGAAFEAALQALDRIEAEAPHVAVASPTDAAVVAPPAASTSDGDPARFLASVMNDAAAPLALRVEAARILLQHGTRS